jgi:signal transduction histidine kinase/CheY-like chemotaxis protein
MIRESNEHIEELERKILEKDREINQLSRIGLELTAGILQYNFNTNTMEVSDTLLQILRNCFPENAVTLDNLLSTVAAEDKVFLQELFSWPKTVRRKVTGSFKLSQKSKDYRETKFFLIVGSYETTPDNENVLICVIKDATKEVKQLKDLQRNLERSEESDRIKTNFLLNISHNIRTPMNSILGFAELLNMTDPDPARRREYIEVIKKQSKTLIQLIDNVAEIAKYESGNMTITKTPVNINLLLKEVVKDVDNIRSASRKEHVFISLNLPSKTGVEIFTDSGRLHQIFINLVNHSLKYTAEGTIEIGYSIGEESRIDFYVKDTSPGLTKTEIKTIFDRFTLLDREELSRYDDETGLSLSIAKSIVRLLGGKISAESEEDKGVTFNFSLPYEKIPSHVPNSIEDELISVQFKWSDKVILIVEDEDVNGLFLEAVFQETGAQTLYAKNGKQAIELCKSISKIDLILMDIKMPVLNGLKATQEIRKFNPTIPIIAQTALSLEEDRQNCLQAGCNDLITKPIEVEELLVLVNRYFTN